MSPSQWPRGLRRRSAAARLLRLWVRITPEAYMPVRCECYVLSCRGLCDGPITRPEESCRLWCVVVCDLEISWTRRPWPTGDCRVKSKTVVIWDIEDVVKEVTGILYSQPILITSTNSWSRCSMQLTRYKVYDLVNREDVVPHLTQGRDFLYSKAFW